jgi:hypothetical protein
VEFCFIMNKQFNRRVALAIVGISSALSATGCATYQQPSLPAKDLAVVGIDPATTLIGFYRIDGAFLSKLGGLSGGFFALSTGTEQILLPGKRSVTVQYQEFLAYGDRTEGYSTMTFEAKAGERYIVHEQHKNKAGGNVEFYTWITDTSGTIVPLIKADK